MDGCGYCKNCKYFSKTHPKIGEEIEGFGFCKNEIYQYSGKDEQNERALFLYTDEESFSAWFMVNERFGCIGFKIGTGSRI